MDFCGLIRNQFVVQKMCFFLCTLFIVGKGKELTFAVTTCKVCCTRDINFELHYYSSHMY